MRIAICDDSPSDLQFIQEFLQQEIAMKKDFDFKGARPTVDLFTSGEELLAQIDDGAVYDVLLIDILMGKYSGIETVRRINATKQIQDYDLIFITNSSEYALDAFDVRAIDYLIKPVDGAKLRRALSRCKCFQAPPDCLTLPQGKKDIRIVKSEIAYVESFGHICVFHTQKREIKSYVTMEATLKLLTGPAFVRCHKSYIVNFAHVKEVCNDYLVLKDDDMIIPVNRTMRKQIQELYDSFLILSVWGKRSGGR